MNIWIKYKVAIEYIFCITFTLVIKIRSNLHKIRWEKCMSTVVKHREYENQSGARRITARFFLLHASQRNVIRVRRRLRIRCECRSFYTRRESTFDLHFSSERRTIDYCQAAGAFFFKITGCQVTQGLTLKKFKEKRINARTSVCR